MPKLLIWIVKTIEGGLLTSSEMSLIVCPKSTIPVLAHPYMLLITLTFNLYLL